MVWGSGGGVAAGLVRGLSLVWVGELALYPAVGWAEKGGGSPLSWLWCACFLCGGVGFGWLSEWCGWPSGLSVLFSRGAGLGVLRDSEELLEHVSSEHVERVCARVACKVALKCLLCALLSWWSSSEGLCDGAAEESPPAAAGTTALLVSQSCVVASLIVLVLWRQGAATAMLCGWLVCCCAVYGTSVWTQLRQLYLLATVLLLSWGLFKVSGGQRIFLVCVPTAGVLLLSLLPH
jgi:hypothetical protein